MRTQEEWWDSEEAMMRLTITLVVEQGHAEADVALLETAARQLAGKEGVVSLEIKHEYKGADLPY